MIYQKMSIKRSLMLLGIAGTFAFATACNAPQSNETEEVDPGTENMYEDPMPAEDTTSAMDTTAVDTATGDNAL